MKPFKKDLLQLVRIVLFVYRGIWNFDVKPFWNRRPDVIWTIHPDVRSMDYPIRRKIYARCST